MKWLKTKKQKPSRWAWRPKADEADPKMFATGETNCPVYLLKKLIQVLNPGGEALFQRPKRKFSLNDEIWFDRAPLGVNNLGNMIK